MGLCNERAVVSPVGMSRIDSVANLSYRYDVNSVSTYMLVFTVFVQTCQRRTAVFGGSGSWTSNCFLDFLVLDFLVWVFLTWVFLLLDFFLVFCLFDGGGAVAAVCAAPTALSRILTFRPTARCLDPILSKNFCSSVQHVEQYG